MAYWRPRNGGRPPGAFPAGLYREPCWFWIASLRGPRRQLEGGSYSRVAMAKVHKLAGIGSICGTPFLAHEGDDAGNAGRGLRRSAFRSFSQAERMALVQSAMPSALSAMRCEEL